MKILKRISVLLLIFMQIFTVTSFADAIGYDIKQYDAYVYVVTPDGGLNLRQGPGTQYEIITKIPDYENLHIVAIDKTGQWGYTSYQGNYGFVYMDQTKANLPYKEVSYDVTITSPDGYLHWRKGPRSSYEIMSSLPNGTKLHVIGELNGFGLATCYDKTGWIYLGETTKDVVVDNSSNAQNNSKQEKTEENPEKQATDNTKEEDSTQSEKEESTENESNDSEFAKDSSKEIDKVSSNTSSKNLIKYFLIGSAVILVIGVSVVSIVLINRKRG